jgi:hypothetical protein
MTSLRLNQRTVAPEEDDGDGGDERGYASYRGASMVGGVVDMVRVVPYLGCYKFKLKCRVREDVRTSSGDGDGSGMTTEVHIALDLELGFTDVNWRQASRS